MLAGLSEREQGECLNERESPELRQPKLELAIGLVGGDGCARLQDDRPRIERGHHAHDRHARFDEAIADRCLNG